VRRSPSSSPGSGWLAPIDLIPEFIPVIGPLDDIVVVALALRYAGRQVPRGVLLAAWPGEPRLLERLLGPAKPADPSARPPRNLTTGKSQPRTATDEARPRAMSAAVSNRSASEEPV
jgi:hypothetical protein